MKRILFIINSLGKGGGERVVVNLANEMCQNYEVNIITIHDDLDYELKDSVKVWQLDHKRGRLSKLLAISKLKKQLNHLVKSLEKEKEFDLITIHLPFAHLITRNTYFSKRSFFVIHTVYSKKMNLSLGKLVLNHMYRNKNIITVSEGVKNEFDQIFNVKYKSIQVIPNPIDIRLIQKEAKEQLEIDFKYLLGIGRFEEIKRFDLLIKAFSQSHASKIYKLVLLGDGNEKEKLENLCLELGIRDKVVFPGWQNNPYKWMKNSELLVVTSKYESLGNTILEALACHTKVISVDCDYGPREILKGELAPFLITNQTAENIAKFMDQSLADYPTDRESYILQYDIANIVQRYLEVSHG